MEYTLGSLLDPKVGLQSICEVLNAFKDTERGVELLALIKQWQQAPSLKAMLAGDRTLWNEVSVAWRPVFKVSETGKGAYFDNDDLVSLDPNPRAPHASVVRLFALLILNPLCQKLGGPCARCGRYYIKKRASQRVYCSAHCGNAATAARRMSEKWADQSRKKLRRAQQAVQRWQRTKKTAEPWKEWIARHYPDISRKFLTRAVNSGRLSEPPVNKGGW